VIDVGIKRPVGSRPIAEVVLSAIADDALPGQNGKVSAVTRMMVVGGTLLAISLIVFRFTSAELLAWVLMAASLPLVFEAAAWGQAESISGWRYNVAHDTFRDAYSFRSAIPRMTLLYTWLFSILAARELEVLPDNGWLVSILFGPLILWVALAARSHHRSIRNRMAAR
jgi:hypothetical protein